ncbi:hypothetical protein [Azospirillum argentinense]
MVQTLLVPVEGRVGMRLQQKPGKLMTRKAGLGNRPRHSGNRRRVTS